jgi:flagellar biosynthesis protein FlhG
MTARDDQATGLRRLFARGATPVGAIAGTDADAATVALARACADVGERVLILDRSRGAVAAHAGTRARHELWHVLEGDATAEMALLRIADDVTLLPAARGLDLLAAGRDDWRDGVAAALGRFAATFDTWIVHGLPPAATGCARPIFMVNPTRAGVTDAYARIKALAASQGRSRFGIVAARVAESRAGEAMFTSLAATAKRFLGVELALCGQWPADGAALDRLRAALAVTDGDDHAAAA